MEDELEAIKAIFCEPEEYTLHQKGDGLVTGSLFSLNVEATGSGPPFSVTVTVTVKVTYPESVPEVSISSSELTRNQALRMKEDLMEYAHSMKGAPMLLDISLWIRENVAQYASDAMPSDISNHDQVEGKFDENWMHVLHIDHMRAKMKYTKTIQKWTEEFGVKGRLLFCDRLILLLLQGDISSIKAYVHRHKTVNVDIDSKGRSCKERMMSVLAEVEISQQNMFSDFQVCSLSSTDELKELFLKQGLDEIYSNHIHCLIKR